MPKLRKDLVAKEQQIIASVEGGEVKPEYVTKRIKVARRSKVLSVRLNHEYRILFRWVRHKWIHFETIHRKELEKAAKSL